MDVYQMVDQEAREVMTVRRVCFDPYEKDSVMTVPYDRPGCQGA